VPFWAITVTVMTPRTGPSSTSFTAAAARAAHLVVDQDPRIFTDPLAAALLGDRAEELLAYHRNNPTHPILAAARAEVICRSRFTEDLLAAAVARGTDQYVILGAGLDTFAHRSELAARVHVFEVDHPSTQEWKRRALSSLPDVASGRLTWVPADLETDPLRERLQQAGFDPSRPAVVSVLGVTVYLSSASLARTLQALGGLATGTELVADYMLPAEMRDATADAYVDGVAPVAARSGEPWLTLVTPDQMSEVLRESGFGSVTHRRQHDAIDPLLWRRTDALRPGGLSMLVHAVVGR
jgi:methyltransferase (TIGR00027 family)